jgi:hypothetical protein
MPQFCVEDWKRSNLLRIVDTSFTRDPRVVGYVEPYDAGWRVWFNDLTPFSPTNDYPAGTHAEFQTKEQAITTVETLTV